MEVAVAERTSEFLKELLTCLSVCCSYRDSCLRNENLRNLEKDSSKSRDKTNTNSVFLNKSSIWLLSRRVWMVVVLEGRAVLLGEGTSTGLHALRTDAWGEGLCGEPKPFVPKLQIEDYWTRARYSADIVYVWVDENWPKVMLHLELLQWKSTVMWLQKWDVLCKLIAFVC